MDQAIKFLNVTKKYGNNIILNNVNLCINDGEKILIIGPSGSGKSTFLRCINRLEKIDSGSIELQNVKFDKNDITSQIGMVFQHFNLFPHMNVLKNLTYAPIKILKTSQDAAEEKAKRMLEIVDLKDKIHSNIQSLSGGQKQRIAIARTLMMDPSIILFDEPVSALDHSSGSAVMQIITNLSKLKITTLIVSHNVDLVQNIADRTLLFEAGLIRDV